jgi:hypothetical protein
MIKEKYDAIVTKLLDATEKGSLAWEKTSSNEEFQVKLGKNAVSISHYDPSDWFNLATGNNGATKRESCSLSIFNSEGKEIDGETYEKDDIGYDNLFVLYKEARRQCLHVDETLDEIINSL